MLPRIKPPRDSVGGTVRAKAGRGYCFSGGRPSRLAISSSRLSSTDFGFAPFCSARSAAAAPGVRSAPGRPSGARTVNDPGATNVAQIVIAGTKRQMGNGEISMPAFGDAYSDDEVAAVVTYIRTSWGNRGAAVSARQANELRAATLN